LASNALRCRLAVVCIAALVATVAPRADAQLNPVKRLAYDRDTSFNLGGMGLRQIGALIVRRDGYMVAAPQYYYGTAIAIDSAGRKQPWSMEYGRGRDAEVGWVQQMGWSGDSIWVVDAAYEQVALLGKDGKVAYSVAFPSWVRPMWRDRRQYPLFSRMTWLAMYGDGTMLVVPSQIRRLFDTPRYDPDLTLLVRVDRDGRILHTVARVPLMDGRLNLRTGTERKTVNVPFYARTYWRSSSDGERVAVVTPITSDSGAFRVTMLNGQGDTVYSRTYSVPAKRVPKAAVDSFLTTVKEFGRYSELQMRDTVRKLIPVFQSPVVGVTVGLDQSAWVSYRTPTTDVREVDWLVIDAKGDVVGTTVTPRMFRMNAATVDRLWTIENDRTKQTSVIVRYARSSKAVRPARSASGSGSSTPARPRE
jgi:hypothetical protein